MQSRFERRRRRQRKRAGALGVALVVAAALVAVLTLSLAGSAPRRGAQATGKQPASTTRPTSATTTTTTPAVFQGADGPSASWVVAENKKPGTTRWKITGPQSATGIMGYASRVQARAGQGVWLYVSTQAPSFHVDAFRMGYYGGKGARLVWRSSQLPGKVQAPCPVTPGINMVQCNWGASLHFVITSNWVQGQYLLKLVGSGGQQSYVPLTVWDPASKAAYVIMSGVLTQQVFNPFGGYDIYQGATPCAPNHYPCSSRSRVVSFDRPYANSYGNGAASYLSLVYPLTRFAEKHGLDVTYWTDITLATHGSLLSRHKVLISPGHDEEYSLRMRNALVAARAKGVNLIFFGASPVLRKVRLQASPLGPNMEVVNYRNPQADPLYGKDNARVSQNWWGQPPANLPASTLVGARYIGYNNSGTFPLQVSDASSWLFKGTGLANGAKIPGVITSDLQAYDPARANNPPNVEILDHSPVSVDLHPNLHYADTTYYTTAASKAGVFQSGTIGWIPSLISCPGATSSCPAPTMRKLTANLLRVFGAGPVGISHPSKANWQQFYG